jgi:hypothetical protein
VGPEIKLTPRNQFCSGLSLFYDKNAFVSIGEPFFVTKEVALK